MTMIDDYIVTLNYGDTESGRFVDEPSPTEDDIVDWIVAGMEKAGFTSANVTCTQE